MPNIPSPMPLLYSFTTKEKCQICLELCYLNPEGCVKCKLCSECVHISCYPDEIAPPPELFKC